MPILKPNFYRRKNTCLIAKELLGKTLVTHIDGQITKGLITETEAYCGTSDMACHARNHTRTPRTEIMYQPGGVAYVYWCYGIFPLFNVITHIEDEPHAVLIRAVQPILGIDLMQKRRGKTNIDKTLCTGPGCVSLAMGITIQDNGISLQSDRIQIVDEGYHLSPIVTTTRIGVESCGVDAQLPYRFYLSDNKWVSKFAKK